MRKYAFILMLLMAQVSYASEPQNIVIKSRLDLQSSASFIKRIRTFLMNNDFGDPYNRQVENPVVVDFNQVLDELPENTVSWIKELQSFLNLKLFESSYKLKIENFSYTIQSFNSELNPIESGLNRVDYVTLNYVQGLKLAASKIIFQVELNRTSNGSPIVFDIELISPEFVLSPEATFELPMGWHTALLPGSMLLSLHTINLSKVFEKIVARPDLIELHIQEVNMPVVSIRVGSKEVTFNKEKIKKFMLLRRNDMKLAILDLLNTRMDERFSNIIKDKPQEIFLPRIFTIKSSINSIFDLKTLNAEQSSRLLEASLDGHFCANENGFVDDSCQTAQFPTKMRRTIDNQTFDQSMKEIDLLFMEKRANVALSISEHYLNQLITAADQAKIFDLGGEGFTLGSEKAFVLAEEKGEGFNLYLDIIYKLKGSQRILVGRSELRFPVRLSIGLKMILVDGVPHLQIKVLAVKTDEKLLVEGLPQYQLGTNVDSVRFRSKVVASILEDIGPFDQKLLLDLELEELKGTYLEQLSFFSDGKGRANAILFMNGQKILR